MKKLTLLIIALFVSQSLLANTIDSSFQDKSPITKGLKIEILKRLKQDFPCLKNDTLEEVKTTYSFDIIDQGIKDFFYTTNFTGILVNDQSILEVEIIVNSADYEIHNPSIQRHRVESVEADANCY